MQGRTRSQGRTCSKVPDWHWRPAHERPGRGSRRGRGRRRCRSGRAIPYQLHIRKLRPPHSCLFKCQCICTSAQFTGVNRLRDHEHRDLAIAAHERNAVCGSAVQAICERDIAVFLIMSSHQNQSRIGWVCRQVERGECGACHGDDRPVEAQIVPLRVPGRLVGILHGRVVMGNQVEVPAREAE